MKIIEGRNFGSLLEEQHTLIVPTAEDTYFLCGFDRCRLHITKACQTGAFKGCHIEDCELVLEANGPGMSAFDGCLIYNYRTTEALQ